MLALSSEAWTAIAAWMAAVVGLIGVGTGLWQVRELRRTREEEAQPYVVVFMESTISPEFIDLVVRNFGKTAAYHVKVSFDPQPVRSIGNSPEAVRIPDEIPSLAPGQEWRTFWDRDMDRKGKSLPDRHDVVVSYQDFRGRDLRLPSRLDWNVYEGTFWVGKKGLHDAAKSLEKIAGAIKARNT